MYARKINDYVNSQQSEAFYTEFVISLDKFIDLLLEEEVATFGSLHYQQIVMAYICTLVLFNYKNKFFIFKNDLSEPGYYEDGKFGIRIENIVRIIKAETRHNYRDRGFLTFKTVTLVPIQTKLIDPSMLTKKEVSLALVPEFSDPNKKLKTQYR